MSVLEWIARHPILTIVLILAIGMVASDIIRSYRS
jgi:hypothetical protein